MKKIIAVAAGLLALSTTTAFAHPGVHDFSFVGSLYHLVTEPDHLAMMAGVAALGYGFWRWRKACA